MFAFFNGEWPGTFILYPMYSKWIRFNQLGSVYMFCVGWFGMGGGGGGFASIEYMIWSTPDFI